MIEAVDLATVADALKGKSGGRRPLVLPQGDRHRLGSANKRVPELGGKSDKLSLLVNTGLRAIAMSRSAVRTENGRCPPEVLVRTGVIPDEF
jgi:hypothetical protein